MSPSIHGVLLFRVAAGRIGMGNDEAAGKRLKRLVLAKERSSNATIAVRGEGSERPIRGITMAAIEQHLPELLPAARGASMETRTALIAEARAYLSEFDERSRQIARGEAEAAIGQLVQPQIDALTAANEEALKLCRDVARRISQTTPTYTAKDTSGAKTDA